MIFERFVKSVSNVDEEPKEKSLELSINDNDYLPLLRSTSINVHISNSYRRRRLSFLLFLSIDLHVMIAIRSVNMSNAIDDKKTSLFRERRPIFSF